VLRRRRLALGFHRGVCVEGRLSGIKGEEEKVGGTVPHGISSLGPTGAIVLDNHNRPTDKPITPFWWSQGAAADTETRPRHQLGRGVVNVAPRVSLNHPKQP